MLQNSDELIREFYLDGTPSNNDVPPYPSFILNIPTSTVKYIGDDPFIPRMSEEEMDEVDKILNEKEAYV